MCGALLVGVVGGWMAPQPALACGGLFCDNGPQPMPVDQTGENILFVIADGTVEAHIQIQYAGEAPRFSWVLPLTSLPEFSVGNQLLFNELLRVSVPSYGLNQTADQCSAGFGSPFSAAESDGRNTAGTGGSSNGGPPPGPTVVLRKAVGAYDIAVLQGGTTDEVVAWLNANNYVVLPGTQPILDDYVRENFLFAAVKLVNGAGVDEIHPLVVKYTGGAPCVPLKLTAVAAQADMGVRTFFLGNGRVVPRHYKHLEVNPLRIDWLNTGTNYREVLSTAANDPVSGGQAFVTEMAGPHNAVEMGSPFGAQNQLNISAFHNAAWDAGAFETAQPTQVTNMLRAQGLITGCSETECTYFHPLVGPLLQQYLPAPAGVSEGLFYGNTPAYAAMVDMTAWDAAAFAADFAARVVTPARHARDLVGRFPYLTRLFTLISPEEMTVDPEFHERADLPPVPATRIATQNTRCDGTTVVTLPDGREVWLGSSTSWPTWSPSMPWAMVIEDIPVMGDIIRLVDNTQAIDAQLSTFNDGQRTDNRCACSTTPQHNSLLGGMLLAGLLLLTRKRRGV